MMNKEMKKITAGLSASIVYLSFIKSVFAQRSVEINTTGIPGYPSISAFLTAAIRLAFIIALIAVLVMLIWGAVEWIFSGGNKDAVASARGRIVHALIGLAILAIALALVSLAGTFVGINILGPLPIPTPSTPAPVIPAPPPNASPI